MPVDAIRLMMMEMHQAIEKTANDTAECLAGDKPLNLRYPPNAGLSPDEAIALEGLPKNDALKRALHKVVAHAAVHPLYWLFCMVDGIGDPEGWEGTWLGCRFEPILQCTGENREPLHMRLYDSYWDWRKVRPDTGPRLDAWEE
jgi:hypothetical protein